MRILRFLLFAAIAVSLVGCKGDSTASKEPSGSQTTGSATDSAKPANREAEVAGTWTLDIDRAKFEPSADTQKELDKQPAGSQAVAELEKQLKDQLKAKLGDAIWTFNADKTVTIKSKAENASGTWSISGDEVTLKTDKGPETKMTLSSDGTELAAKAVQEQGAITMILKKG